jgi:hypothetical protein
VEEKAAQVVELKLAPQAVELKLKCALFKQISSCAVAAVGDPDSRGDVSSMKLARPAFPPSLLSPRSVLSADIFSASSGFESPLLGDARMVGMQQGWCCFNLHMIQLLRQRDGSDSKKFGAHEPKQENVAATKMNSTNLNTHNGIPILSECIPRAVYECISALSHAPPTVPALARSRV